MIRRKLRSQNGVSILMMLLVFLLCAAIGSAILTAATASVGRIADLTETDRRYYSVVSAAKLFASQIDGQTVTIYQKKTMDWELRDEESGGDDPKITFKSKISDDPWADDATPPASFDDSGDVSYGLTWGTEGAVFSSSSHTLLEDLAAELYGRDAAGNEATNAEDAWDNGWGKSNTPTEKRRFTVEVQDDSGTSVGDTVYGRVTMDGTRLEALFSDDRARGFTKDPDDDVLLVRVSAQVALSYPKPGDPEEERLKGSEEDPASEDYVYRQEWKRWTRIQWTDVTIREGR